MAKIGNIQNQELARGVVLLAAGLGILETKDLLSRILHARTAASVVTTVAVFAMMPLLRRFWPLEGEKPLTAKTWIAWGLMLTALGVGTAAIEAPPRFLSSWFNAHPLLGKIESAGGGLLVPGALLLICGLLYFRRRKAPQDERSGR